MALLSSLSNIDATILQPNVANLTHILLFGDTTFDNNSNILIPEATMNSVASCNCII